MECYDAGKHGVSLMKWCSFLILFFSFLTILSTIPSSLVRALWCGGCCPLWVFQSWPLIPFSLGLRKIVSYFCKKILCLKRDSNWGFEWRSTWIWCFNPLGHYGRFIISVVFYFFCCHFIDFFCKPGLFTFWAFKHFSGFILGFYFAILSWTLKNMSQSLKDWLTDSTRHQMIPTPQVWQSEIGLLYILTSVWVLPPPNNGLNMHFQGFLC